MRARTMAVVRLMVISLAVAGLLAGAAQASVIQNGLFEGGATPMGTSGPLDGVADTVPNNWTRFESFMGVGVENSAISVVADNGPSAPGASCLRCTRSAGGSSGDWTTVQQNLSLDASGYSSLSLSIDVKVDSHDLEAGGWVPVAWEWPVMLEIEYVPTGGAPPTQIWRYGWYLVPPGDAVSGPAKDPGQGLIPIYNDQPVPAGVWVTTTFDLFKELPQLGTITRIRVGGSGWDFEGQADNLVITGRGQLIPEPAGLGLIGLAMMALRRRSRQAARRRKS